MSEPNESYAYFTVTGEDLNPEHVTQIVGITPSESWKKGDLNQVTRQGRRIGRWSLHSRLPRSESLEAHITDVLAQLDQNSEGFQQITETYDGCMQLVGYFHSYYPGLCFTAAMVERLAKYKLGVDHDFYYLHSDAREDADV